MTLAVKQGVISDDILDKIQRIEWSVDKEKKVLTTKEANFAEIIKAIRQGSLISCSICRTRGFMSNPQQFSFLAADGKALFTFSTLSDGTFYYIDPDGTMWKVNRSKEIRRLMIQ
ncbi:hypothetical protein A3F08_01485 [Candidatus Berkelbacteria bacterium RIFCSPHIGHO2_12_FULL_36_9]|uniref:Uncharacterized protein n=1 Tax=Candidatus Berkelbacteria bacterium RIFCSPHIGHO2_12_FULL_36_9 TaxID=1797469 RepID=A0A1F5EK90_9BACT|nr:MAG: hypothetical protein A3F08_01485 [Candidatus Berkelbacteria bacterium RIFCSPHIGHO2_12_FULL_36_9]